MSKPSKPYVKVEDGRKQEIRGLWIRGSRYYAQLAYEDPETGKKKPRRIPLEGATTVAEAQKLLAALKVDRERGQLRVTGRTPPFTEYADAYSAFVKGSKRESTLKTEGYAIDRLKEFFKETRLSRINKGMVKAYRQQRQTEGGVSARTINLEVTILNNILNHAIGDDEILFRLPTENMRPLKHAQRVKKLVTPDDLTRLCEKAQGMQSGQQFADYIWLMAYSGARMTEALHLQWEDIDWQNRQLIIGAHETTKNYKIRRVNFNPKLEAHLKDMKARSLGVSRWLFPSPRRGEEDRPTKTLRETLNMARQEAQLPHVGFHDCRHTFISYAAMSGTDFATIAAWVGHQDGGKLIGKVYSHLADDHKRRAADNIVFGLQVVSPEQVAGVAQS